MESLRKSREGVSGPGITTNVRECLIIADESDRFRTVSYYRCWLAAFRDHSSLRTRVLDVSRLKRGLDLPDAAKALLAEKVDLIVVHQSAMWHIDSRWWPILAKLIALKRAEKVVFFVNEYRFLWNQLRAAKAVGATVLASQFPQDVAQRLYGRPNFGGLVLAMPNAVDTEAFKETVPWSERPIDIGFRGDPYPIYLGHDDRERLTTYFQKHAADLGLSADIVVSRDDRLTEPEWNAFLNRCRSLIGHEAGGRFVDLHDVYRNFFTHAHEIAPDEVFRKLVQGVIASGFAQHAISGRIAAPRHLEAGATRTVQILFPGRYNDLISPDEHYLVLQPDFSNVEDVAEKLRDARLCGELTERAYKNVMANHLYRHRIDALLAALDGKR